MASGALTVAGVVALLLIMWHLRDAAMMAVAAMVVAVLIDACARPLRRHGGVPREAAVVIAILAILLVVAILGALIGGSLLDQLRDLIARLPAAVRRAEEYLGLPFIDTSDGAIGLVQDGGWRNVLQGVTTIGSTIIGILTTTVLIIVTGVFLAIDPHTYRRGLVKMFPSAHHERIDTALRGCAGGLRRWLVAELIAMLFVGTAAAAGTWWIGLPAPMALGLLAGVAEFVPVVGPIIGAVPAVLLSVTYGVEAMAWTSGLFLVIQQVESNLITPMVQRKLVKIPPAVLIFAVLAAGILFGVMGVIVAGPLAVIVFILVRHLYLRDVRLEEI